MSDGTRQERSLGAEYMGVGAILLPFVGVLLWITRQAATSVAGERLIAPILVLVALTIAVLVLAAVVRNLAVMRGAADPEYYKNYKGAGPNDVIERPARTYDNLLQFPILFYLLCILMMLTESVDSVQVALAWLFVVTRLLHAALYILINRVPLRFALFLCGVIAVSTMLVRFALALG